MRTALRLWLFKIASPNDVEKELSTGKVVDCAFTFSDPHDLEADQKASFEVLLMSNRVPLVDSYELTAESDQYAVIPEFSTLIAWVVVIGVTTLLILLHAEKLNTHSKKSG